MFDAVFRLLFKYPLLFFEQGNFVFGVSRPMLAVLLIAAAVGAFALLSYRSVAKSRRDRAVLIAFRLAVLAVVLFCLLRPALILKAAVPQQNFLGVLIDDSRSF